jgi:hypothetical protein
MPVFNGNDLGRKELSDLPDMNFTNFSGLSDADSGKVVLIAFTFRPDVKSALSSILSKPKKETLPVAVFPPSLLPATFRSVIFIPARSRYLLMTLVIASFSSINNWCLLIMVESW